jgi:hypothetical protein
MANFFQKRSREKLYKQWVEKEGLSPEDLPADLKKDARHSTEADEKLSNKISPHREYRPDMGLQVNSIFSSISVRFILAMAVVIIILLVALAVVSTVLIMRGC